MPSQSFFFLMHISWHCDLPQFTHSPAKGESDGVCRNSLIWSGLRERWSWFIFLQKMGGVEEVCRSDLWCNNLGLMDFWMLEKEERKMARVYQRWWRMREREYVIYSKGRVAAVETNFSGEIWLLHHGNGGEDV